MRRASCILGFVGLTACASEDGTPLGVARFGLVAYCEANVIGSGVVDVETDYLAHVVQCENGAASFEALRAQAVSARSYLYYELERSGSIGDGQGSQVYSCGRTPTDAHYDAVASTSGQVLRYRDTQVAAFYVAGALQTSATCTGGTNDPTGTERWVTYNEGQSGAAVEQTRLGFVSPTNYANRGCMSQNGADCLSDAGRPYHEILRFYYGADIEMLRAEGPCVAPPLEPDPVPDPAPDPPEPDSADDPTGDPSADPGEPGDGAEPPADDAGEGGLLTGGCSTSGRGGRSPTVFLVLLAVAAAGSRRLVHRLHRRTA
jgi:MYXO-CTERM domain-containing protein